MGQIINLGTQSEFLMKSVRFLRFKKGRLRLPFLHWGQALASCNVQVSGSFNRRP